MFVYQRVWPQLIISVNISSGSSWGLCASFPTFRCLYFTHDGITITTCRGKVLISQIVRLIYVFLTRNHGLYWIFTMKYPPIQGVFSCFQGKAWLDETSAWCWMEEAVHKIYRRVYILLNAVPTKIIYQHYKGFYGRSNRSKLKISRWHVTQCFFLLRV